MPPLKAMLAPQGTHIIPVKVNMSQMHIDGQKRHKKGNQVSGNRL